MKTLTLALACLTLHAGAETSFQVKDYRIHDFFERGLTLGLAGQSGHGNTNAWNSGIPSYSFRQGPTSQFSLNPVLQSHRVTQPFEIKLILPMNFSYSQYRRHTESDAWSASRLETDSRGWAWAESAYPEVDALWYPDDVWHLGVSSLGDLRGDQWVSDTSSQSTSSPPSATLDVTDRRHLENDYYSFSTKLVSKAGVGRLIESKSAWKALELVREFERRGVLLKPLTHEDMQKLSGMIANSGQAFLWDARERRLSETRQYHAFFVERGYLPEGSLDGVVALMDMTLAYPNVARLNGKSAFAYMQWDHRSDHASRREGYWKNGIDTDTASSNYNTVTLNEASPAVGAEVAWASPVSRSWQLGLNSRLYYLSYYQDRAYQDNRGAVLITTLNDISETLRLSVDYLPSTRLVFSWSGTTKVGRSRHEFGMVPSSFIGFEDYDKSYFSQSNRFSLSWQAAHYVVIQLYGSLFYSREDRSLKVSKMVATSPGVDDFLQRNGYKQYDGGWSSQVGLNLTYRLF